jgi:hypothetical protein
MQDDEDLGLGTEDEPDEEQEQEEQETEPAGDVASLQRQLKKKNQENHSLRVRERRAVLTTEYGKEVAELIPATLPLKEWKDYAEKLAALKGPASEQKTTQEQEATQEEVPEEEPSEAEKRLATAGTGSSLGTSATGSSTMEAGEILKLGKKDPERAWEEIQRYQPHGLLHGEER